MGILRIYGKIDINQFWPTGTSDADTTKIKINIGDDSFKFKESQNGTFKATKAFNGAISKGQVSKPVIKIKKSDGSKSITVRLQGVDAPELHYKAAPLKGLLGFTKAERKEYNSINKERRQCFAESATYALSRFLKQFSNQKGTIDAYFESQVENPSDVVDTYGRFIGDIFVGKQKDINLWLVRNGWGFPTFYTSMTIEEIQKFLDAWQKGKKVKGRLGKNIGKDAKNFNWKLLYRKPPISSFHLGDDKGKVLMPKLFRRQTSWLVSKKAGIIPNNISFKDYLDNSSDELFLLDDILDSDIHSSTIFTLDDFISRENKVLINPEKLIFREKPGTLVNSKGRKITKW